MAKAPRERGGTNIRFDCKKACGDCSWSRIDPITKKPAYEPVEGWKAIKVPYIVGGSSSIGETYYITECPEFEADDEYVDPFFIKHCVLCGELFQNGEPSKRKYCYKCVPLGYARNIETGRIYKHTWHRRKEEGAKEKGDIDD